MPMTSRLSRRSFAKGTLGLAAATALPVHAQAITKLKLILNWRYQGPQSWFFIAQDKGYFKEEGIELTIDQGDGSGAAVGRI